MDDELIYIAIEALSYLLDDEQHESVKKWDENDT